MAVQKTDETAFADAARSICGHIECECGITVPADTLLDVARLIRAIVDMHVAGENSRAVAICEARASLWDIAAALQQGRATGPERIEVA